MKSKLIIPHLNLKIIIKIYYNNTYKIPILIYI